MREQNQTQGHTVIEHELPVLSDEQLEFWGNFYVQNNLHARGILFETFLCAPQEVAEAVIFGREALLPPLRVEEFYPPLRAQERVAVEVLKKAIEDGTYKGDDARVAHKLIELWMRPYLGMRCD